MVDEGGGQGPVFDPQRVKAHGEAVADALREHLAGAMDELMTQFYDKARGRGGQPDAAKAQGIRDALSQLRSHGEALRHHLIEQIRNNFDPDAEQRAMQATMNISFDELSLQNTESLDESIAVTNVGNRGELIYEHQLWELRQRMEWWRDERFPLVSDKSLAPYALCRAFFQAMSKTGLKAELRMSLFWQFDRYVMRHLHDTYDELIKILDRHGFSPLRPTAQAAKTSRPAPGGEATSTALPPEAAASASSDLQGEAFDAATATPAGASTDQLRQRIDPQTWQMLNQFSQAVESSSAAPAPGGHSNTAPSRPAASLAAGQAAAAEPAGSGQASAGASAAPGAYSDQQLAQELTSVLSGQPVEGWNTSLAQEMNSRVSVVGRAFNQVLADPNLARSVKPQFDILRFSILKTALSDPSFFRDAGHPMRALLSELAELATTSRLYAPQEVNRLGLMLAGMHQHLAISAEEVRAAQEGQTTVSEAELDQFLDELLNDQKARRAALIEKSRRVVSEELWLQTAARHCSDELRRCLETAWEPMMALRLLRYGVDSKLWNRGIELLKRIIDVADPPLGSILADSDRAQLLEEFGEELRSVGMLEERVIALLSALRSALEACTAQPAEARADSGETASEGDGPGEWLKLALVADSWFEIFDRERDCVRWLQAQGLEDEGRLAVFTEFRRNETLRLPVAELIDDLRRGLSAAVNPTPVARAALERLTHQS